MKDKGNKKSFLDLLKVFLGIKKPEANIESPSVEEAKEQLLNNPADGMESEFTPSDSSDKSLPNFPNSEPENSELYNINTNANNQGDINLDTPPAFGDEPTPFVPKSEPLKYGDDNGAISSSVDISKPVTPDNKPYVALGDEKPVAPTEGQVKLGDEPTTPVNNNIDMSAPHVAMGDEPTFTPEEPGLPKFNDEPATPVNNQGNDKVDMREPFVALGDEELLTPPPTDKPKFGDEDNIDPNNPGGGPSF